MMGRSIKSEPRMGGSRGLFFNNKSLSHLWGGDRSGHLACEVLFKVETGSFFQTSLLFISPFIESLHLRFIPFYSIV